MDEKDSRIVDCVIRYPQITVEHIAQLTQIAESTVQKRLADMLADERLARVIEVRDWKAASYPLRYRIDIKINQIALREPEGGGPPKLIEPETRTEVTPFNPSDDDDGAPVVFPEPVRRVSSQKRLGRYIKNQLSRIPDFQGRLVCLDATILLGQEYDMSITIRARDTDSVMDFVTKGLRFLRGVSSTMSSLESWSCADEERR
ncbi:MAG: hypothetical protein SFV18_18320 [Bryobacteraceae bacterium]|nr:hypothetical protein [Bryobacteraceae bacterium]